MKLYSTKNPKEFVNLKEAVMMGLPKDNGLYMPTNLPTLDKKWLSQLSTYSFKEIAYKIAYELIGSEIPSDDLYQIIEDTITFPAPVVQLYDNIYVQELWHGPSMAFKDFGARFMARLMSYFNQGEQKDLNILVATSGDTGGAVAAGFYKTSGINVIILYPKGKVSPIQESQLTTLGENIYAIAIEGDFDDCQRLVKQAFLDESLKSVINLSSANSINIARLIPQSFYYFEGVKQLKHMEHITYVVPSGNLGNLTAGVLAQRMGAPIDSFIAATNSNQTIPKYLKTGKYEPQHTIQTIANAMDVSRPSNFERLKDLFKGASDSSTWNNIKNIISSEYLKDKDILKTIQEIYNETNYLLDPHTAIGVKIAQENLTLNPHKTYIILGTAHFGKFLEVIKEAIPNATLELPKRLELKNNPIQNTVTQSNQYDEFKNYLLRHVSRETN